MSASISVSLSMCTSVRGAIVSVSMGVSVGECVRERE